MRTILNEDIASVYVRSGDWLRLEYTDPTGSTTTVAEYTIEEEQVFDAAAIIALEGEADELRMECGALAGVFGRRKEGESR